MDHIKTGKVICKRRKELGLTQTQLAKSLNISFQAVSKWENCTAYPDLDIIMTGCSTPAVKKYLTATAEAHRTDTVWTHSSHKR